MRKAFSLLEMLIVLAIIAGMAAMTWPAIDKMLARAHKRAEVDKAVKRVRILREKAIEVDGPIWNGDDFYCPFQCDVAPIIIPPFRIKIGEFYEVWIDTPPMNEYNGPHHKQEQSNEKVGSVERTK